MKDNEFVVDVIGIAAFCAAKGLRLLRTEPIRTKRGILAFIFVDPEHRGAGLVGEYFTNGTVCARDYDHEITRCKGMIWDVRHPDEERKARAPLQPNYFPERAR